jgi:hypothetical protein
MTRPLWQRDVAGWLAEAGINDCMIERATGISRATFRDWRRPRYQRRTPAHGSCSDHAPDTLDPSGYAYLLGLYLGDGCISALSKNSFRLRITLDARYPGIIEECRRTIVDVLPTGRRAGTVKKIGCVEVYSNWLHWPCLFPQHGRGPKHLRPIRLEDWQAMIVAQHPGLLLRGLIHSDGYRGLNIVKGKGYPRYMFTNTSPDIRGIFCRACDVYGVRWRPMTWKTTSIARAADVARLDLVVGPKA